MHLNVSFLSGSPRVATLAHADVADGLNTKRIDPESDVQYISPELASQIASVEVQGTLPNETPAGGGERCDIERRGNHYHMRTVSPADLELHRDEVRNLLGDVNVLVLHARYHLPIARYLPLSRAAYLQMEHGDDASTALYESIRQIYGVCRDELQETHPTLARRIDNLANARWKVDPTKTIPCERFPIEGIAAADARPLYRELNDFITSECRKVAPSQKLATEVLNESRKPLIVAFAGDEEFAFTPGLSVDWLKLAQAEVRPRPSVTYVAEPLTDLRLTNDGGATSFIEGFNATAASALWHAITSQPATTIPDPPAVPVATALAIVTPLLFGASGLLIGWWKTLAVAGVLSGLLFECRLVMVALRGRSARPARSAPGEPTIAAHPIAEEKVETAAVTDVVPPAIRKRNRRTRPSSNGASRATAN